MKNTARYCVAACLALWPGFGIAQSPKAPTPAPTHVVIDKPLPLPVQVNNQVPVTIPGQPIAVSIAGQPIKVQVPNPLPVITSSQKAEFAVVGMGPGGSINGQITVLPDWNQFTNFVNSMGTQGWKMVGFSLSVDGKGYVAMMQREH